MPQSYSGLYYHVVYRTKDRHTLLPDNVFERLGAYIGATTRNLGGRLLAYGGMPDHIHLLISLGRDHTISNIMKELKASSSKWIHETFPDLRTFAWQAGYGVFTVSSSGIERVTSYIAHQRQHHARMSYREELIIFLKEYMVEYEEKWLPIEE